MQNIDPSPQLSAFTNCVSFWTKLSSSITLIGLPNGHGVYSQKLTGDSMDVCKVPSWVRHKVEAPPGLEHIQQTYISMTQTTFHNLFSTITPQPTDTRNSHDSQKRVTTLRFIHPTQPKPRPKTSEKYCNCKWAKLQGLSKCESLLKSSTQTQPITITPNSIISRNPIIHEFLNFFWTAMAHTFISETDKLLPQEYSLLIWSSYKNLRL